jgi:sterol desaturase/sphingolipid hydroxylase (fatty acid hydroxylase superfamily)
MSGWIFFSAMVVLVYGIGSRWRRREDRQWELARLDEEIRVAKFWKYDAERERQDRADMIAEHKNWRNNFKFELRNWSTFAIGAALLVLAAVLWVGEAPSRTWDQLWKMIDENTWSVVLLGLAAICVYYVFKRLDKAEREIRWLNHMLKLSKDHAENLSNVVSESVLELKDRLDRLEGKST